VGGGGGEGGFLLGFFGCFLGGTKEKKRRRGAEVRIKNKVKKPCKPVARGPGGKKKTVSVRVGGVGGVAGTAGVFQGKKKKT